MSIADPFENIDTNANLTWINVLYSCPSALYIEEELFCFSTGLVKIPSWDEIRYAEV
jgi:hypothetical protein